MEKSRGSPYAVEMRDRSGVVDEIIE